MSYKPARIKRVHCKLHSFQASLCTLTATHLALIYVCTYIRLSVPLVCVFKQAGIKIENNKLFVINKLFYFNKLFDFDKLFDFNKLLNLNKLLNPNSASNRVTKWHYV